MIGELRYCGRFGQQYQLVQVDSEVQDILATVGRPDILATCLLVLTGDGEYLEVWAYDGTPFLISKFERIA